MDHPQDSDGFDASFAARHGVALNEHSRVYHNGKALPYEQKVTIAAKYLRASTAAEGARPVISSLAKECLVTRATITKVENELFSFGRVLHPKEIRSNRQMPLGPGSVSFNDLDAFVILALYHEEPSRTLRSYALGLFIRTGTNVSESTISRFFNHGFEIKGSLCKPNLIPYDKLRRENMVRAVDYLMTIAKHDRSRIKFGDEKHLKGAELFCRSTRRNVFTGVVPPIMTLSDFRNTYSITGFCGIDMRCSPVRYGVAEGINNAENFAVHIILAVQAGFLLPYDVLVLDRAAIHVGGQNTILADWLWDNFRIFLLLLPARTPEWNPIELVWNILVQRLKTFSLFLAMQMGSHSLVQATGIILDNITHSEVEGCFRKAGV